MLVRLKYSFTSKTMICPRCRRSITPEFYCIGCGFVPVWPRHNVAERNYGRKSLRPALAILGANFGALPSTPTPLADRNRYG